MIEIRGRTSAELTHEELKAIRDELRMKYNGYIPSKKTKDISEMTREEYQKYIFGENDD